METLSAKEAGIEYDRCPAFFRAAATLHLIRAVRLRPVRLEAHSLSEFMQALNPEIIKRINAFLKSKRPRNSVVPTLSEPSRPGRKPGSGKVRELRRDGETSPAVAAPRPVIFVDRDKR